LTLLSHFFYSGSLGRINHNIGRRFKSFVIRFLPHSRWYCLPWSFSTRLSYQFL